MPSLRLEFNKSAIGELALRSREVRNLVGETGASMAVGLGADIGEENVSFHEGGISRARAYVRRLDGISEEALDGRLARILRSGRR